MGWEIGRFTGDVDEFLEVFWGFWFFLVVLFCGLHLPFRIAVWVRKMDGLVRNGWNWEVVDWRRGCLKLGKLEIGKVVVGGGLLLLQC